MRCIRGPGKWMLALIAILALTMLAACESSAKQVDSSRQAIENFVDMNMRFDQDEMNVAPADGSAVTNKITGNGSGFAVAYRRDSVGLVLTNSTFKDTADTAYTIDMANSAALTPDTFTTTTARGAMMPGDNFVQVIVWRKVSNDTRDVQTGVSPGGLMAA